MSEAAVATRLRPVGRIVAPSDDHARLGDRVVAERTAMPKSATLTRGLVHATSRSQNVSSTGGPRQGGRLRHRRWRLGDHSITQAGMIIGSVHYMAPEQAEGRVATAASDIYALGVVLTRWPPGSCRSTAESPLAVARMQIETPPTPPHHLNPSLPVALSDTIWPACRRRPAVGRLQRRLSRRHCAVSAQWHIGHDGRTPAADRRRAASAADRTLQTSRHRPTTLTVPDVPSHTDVLMPEPVIVPRCPATPASQRQRGGFSLWRFFWMNDRAGAVGAGIGRFLAGPPEQSAVRPTPAPVIVAEPTQPPAGRP